MVASRTDVETRTFRAEPADISAADDWIEAVAKRWEIGERTQFGARLCVAEIAGNVLEHGASADRPAEFTLTLRRKGDGLDVEFSDTGRPFDPTANAQRPPTAPTLDKAVVGGLGLRLLRTYASHITYRHDGTRNHVTLHLPASLAGVS
jgi:anti-sigma regulatory factor (Ser/Thr protein kinase)